MNLQSIIDNKNMSHAVTALDLLKMDGYEVIEESTDINNNNLDSGFTANEQQSILMG